LNATYLGWAIAALLTLAWVVRKIRRAMWLRRHRRRLRRALRAESAAERLLEQSGFIIKDRQLHRVWPIVVDGALHPVTIRADLLVSQGELHYIAEVKTGTRAPSVATAATRRQLLEYSVAYQVDGVLLVNMEDCTVQRVEFPPSDGASPWQ
jgi:hypothetical protein